jgi:hypothetical protein
MERRALSFQAARMWTSLVTAVTILGTATKRASRLYASHLRGESGADRHRGLWAATRPREGYEWCSVSVIKYVQGTECVLCATHLALLHLRREWWKSSANRSRCSGRCFSSYGQYGWRQYVNEIELSDRGLISHPARPHHDTKHW